MFVSGSYKKGHKMKKLILIFIFIVSLFAQDKLIFYCGITMYKPMKQIAEKIEKKYGVKIKIIQGGSGDLYDALSSSKKGDLYLPGSDIYIKRHLNSGFFGYRQYIGYNQIAIFVQKYNPKHIKGLDDLIRTDLKISLGNEETCSMGKESIKVLLKYKGVKFLNKVENNVLLYSFDSKDMNQLLKYKKIDVGLNWKATAFFPYNRKYISIIDINQTYAPKKRLLLTMLTFSKHKKIVKAFINFAISPQGQKIMKEYGFLDQ